MALVDKIGSTFNINTTTAGIQFVPAVSALLNGGFVVTWEDFDSGSGDHPTGSTIRAQLFDDQAFRSGGEFLVPGNSKVQYAPDVATLSDGSFVITWSYDFSATDIDTLSKHYNANGTGGAEQSVATTSAGDEFDSNITAQQDGRYLVTWTQDDNRIHFVQKSADGSVLSSGLVDPSPADLNESQSSVAALLDGTYVVAFNQANDIFERRLVAGDNGSIANSTVTGEQRQPSISALEDGGYVVVWTDQELFVKGQRYDAFGNTVGLEFKVNDTSGSVDFTTPIVKSLNGGGFIVVWDDRDAGLRAQSFDEDGAKIGSAVQLTPAGQAGSFGDADVTVRQDGDAVIVWGGVDPDATAGIQGQILRVFHTVNGTAGSDRLMTQLNGGVSNLIPGFQSSDSISGFAGNDVLQGFGGAQDILNGGTGIDMASYIDSQNPVTANLLVPAFNNGDAIGDKYISIEGLEGSFFEDQLIGNNLANTLDGVDGDDTLEGNGGNDTLIGNFGDDFLDGGAGNDRLEGDDDNGGDTMDGGAGNDTYVLGDDTLDTVQDSSGIDTITSTITRSLLGFAAIERLTLLGNGNINGTGNKLDNLLTGNTHNNALVGGIGADTINAGAGNDRLTGGAAHDQMSGGAGNDIFDFNAVTESVVGAQRDVISDFNAGTAATFVDRIDLSTIDANGIAPGNQAFTFIGAAAFTLNHPGQVRAASGGGITVISVNTDNDVAPEMQIQLTGVIPLEVHDFIL